MALPPTIPTSFVPKQPVATPARRQKSGMNLFMIIGIAVAGLSILISACVFGFELYLSGARETKTAALEEAERAVNLDTVEGFIRLKNRLSSVEMLLDEHVTLSGFFTVLEANTLQSVRFSTLSISVADDRSAEIRMEGVARTFNALAAQSARFAGERHIRRAIFSDISVNEDGSVRFSLSAMLDPRLITAGEQTLSVPEEPVLPPAPEPPAPEDAAVPVADPEPAPPATSSPAL